MRTITLAIASTFLLSTGALAAEQRSPGASGNAPGHEMKEGSGKTGGPGASGKAPGHEIEVETGTTGPAGSGSGSNTGSGSSGTRR